MLGVELAAQRAVVGEQQAELVVAVEGLDLEDRRQGSLDNLVVEHRGDRVEVKLVGGDALLVGDALDKRLQPVERAHQRYPISREVRTTAMQFPDASWNVV